MVDRKRGMSLHLFVRCEMKIYYSKYSNTIYILGGPLGNTLVHRDDLTGVLRSFHILEKPLWAIKLNKKEVV